MSKQPPGPFHQQTQDDLAKMGIAGRLESEGRFAPGVDGVLPAEFHLRLNKKIAQLTKVIISINEKNSDHDFTMDCLKYDHHKEIVALNTQHTKDMAEVEARRATTDAAMADLKEVQEEDLRKRTAAEAVAEKTEGQLKTTEDALKDLEELLAASHKQEEEMKANHEDSQSKWAEERRVTEEKHNQKLAHLQQEFDTRVAQMEQALKEAHLENANLQVEVSDEKDAEITAVREEHAEIVKCLNQDHSQQLEQQKATLENLRQTISRRDSTIKEMEKEHTVMVNEFRDANGDASVEIKKLQLDLEKACSARCQKQKKIDELETTVRDLRTTCGEFERACRSHEASISELQSIRDEYYQQSLTLQNRCDKLDSAARLSEGEVCKLRSTVTAQNDEMARINKYCIQLEKEKAAAKDSLGESAQEQALSLAKKDQEIARLNAYQERTQAKWSREMEALQSQVGRDSDLKQRHEEALLRMSQEYEERRKAAERKADDSFREERRSAEARHKKEIAELRAKLDSKLAEKCAAVDRLTSELAALKRQLEEAQQRAQVQGAGLGTVASELAVLKEQERRLSDHLEKEKAAHKQAESRVTELQAEMKKLKSSHAAEVMAAEKKLAEKFDERRKRIDSGWEKKLQEEQEYIYQKLEAEHKVGLDSAIGQATTLWTEQLDRLQHQKLAMEAEMQSDNDQLRKSLAGAEAQLMEKATRCSILEEWNAELSQSLDEKERHSVTEKTDATHTYEAMRSELSATIKRLEDELRKLRADHKRELQNLREAGDLSANALRVDWEQRLSNARQEAAAITSRELEELRAQLLKEQEDALRRQDLSHQQRLLVERESMVGERDLLRAEVADAQRKITQQNQDGLAKEEKISELMASLATAKVTAEEQRLAMESTVSKVAAERQDAEEKIRKREEYLIEKYREESRLKDEEIMAAMGRVQAKVTANEEAWQQHSDQLQEKLEKAMSMPRPTDMESLQIYEEERLALFTMLQDYGYIIKAQRTIMGHQDDTMYKFFRDGSRYPYVPVPRLKQSNPVIPPKSEESRKALLSLRPGQRRSSAPQVAPRVPALSRVQRAREQRLKSQSSGAIEAAALQAQKSLELEQAIARDVREDREQHLRQSASSQNPTRDTGALLPSSPPPLPTSSRMGRSTPLPALGSQGSQDDGASAAAVTLGAVKLPDPRRTQPGHRLQPLPAATSSVKPQTKKPPSTPGHLRKKT